MPNSPEDLSIRFGSASEPPENTSIAPKPPYEVVSTDNVISTSDLSGKMGASTSVLNPTPESPRTKESEGRSPVKRRELFILILKRTSGWIALGVGWMLLGIGIIQAALLPHIHTCPTDATCPNSFDPNRSNVLQLLQIFMQYWIQIGTILAAFGLLKLSAFQSWFIMMSTDGNTIENLDLNLGAIKGSSLDAFRLLFRRGNRWMSTLILVQLGITTAISLIVGLSIDRGHGQQSITFQYMDISRLPDSNLASLNNDNQVQANSKVIAWALSNDTSHESALRGTLVIPDGRSNKTLNAKPGGPRIKGDISCNGVDNYTIEASLGSVKQYKINIKGKTYNARSDFLLATTMTLVGTASTEYLWVSNATGKLLPNASRTSDKLMDIALCSHTIHFDNDTQQMDHNLQYIQPNVPVVSGCESNDTFVCAADSVNNAILQWWGGVGTSFFKMSCRGGVLGPLKSDGTICPLNSDIWTEIVTSMLDGIMRASPRSGRDTQQLTAVIETIDGRRWWLQGLIPLCTLLLYVVMLRYTMMIGQGGNVLKELSLPEIIEAAQTDHVRDLVLTGKLHKSVMRYGSEVGFIRRSHHAP